VTPKKMSIDKIQRVLAERAEKKGDPSTHYTLL
jgi:hypothetical protein